MKKNIIKTINHIMCLNDLVWIKRNYFQGTNYEQTNSCSWFVEEYDYVCGQNEYIDTPDFLEVLSQEELIHILGKICGLHLYTQLVSKSVDTFGSRAGIPYYTVNGMFEEV